MLKGLKGKEFSHDLLDREGLWFNLETNRKIKTVPSTYAYVGIRVFGTKEQLKEFYRLNKAIVDKMVQRKEFHIPCENIHFLCQEEMRRIERNVNVNVIRNIKLEDLTEEEMKNVPDFRLPPVFIKVRVEKVVDGDTLNVIGDINGLVKFTIRAYGFDAAEKDTPEGKHATELLNRRIITLRGIIWCQILDIKEKYGRVLAILFEDQNKTKLLVDCLIKSQIKCVHPYTGGKKKEFK